MATYQYMTPFGAGISETETTQVMAPFGVGISQSASQIFFPPHYTVPTAVALHGVTP